MSESLIQQQPMLFSSDQMPARLFQEEESGRNPTFTAARLFSAEPEKYRAIIALGAEGIGVQRIARILCVSPHTVLAVRAREPANVAIEKQRIASLSREASRMCVEGIIELLSDDERARKIPARDLGILAGILTDKSELLSGGPTVRVETTREVTPEDVREYLDNLPRIGLEEERPAAKGKLLGPAGDPNRQAASDPDGAEVQPAGDQPYSATRETPGPARNDADSAGQGNLGVRLDSNPGADLGDPGGPPDQPGAGSAPHRLP